MRYNGAPGRPGRRNAVRQPNDATPARDAMSAGGTKPLPVPRERLAALLDTYPTPFHLYDEAAIRANARRLQAAFAWAPAFNEYFAVKATPNPYILAILRAAGCG